MAQPFEQQVEKELKSMDQRLYDLEEKMTSIDTKLTQVVDAILGNALTKSGGFVKDIDDLKDKIKDYYVQDYDTFFNERKIIEWKMSDNEFKEYEERKMKSDFKNPIKLITTFADYINLITSKALAVDGILFGKTAIVINYMPYAKKISAILPIFSNVEFVSYHETSPEKFSRYDTIIFYDNIIVKPHTLFYIEPHIKGRCYCLIETSVNLDMHLFNRIYNIELREKISTLLSSGKNNKGL
jgi:hypothetical protein